MTFDCDLSTNKIRLVVLALALFLSSLILANLIVSDSIPVLIAIFLFACGLILYSWHVEAFIVLALFINQDGFNLLPTPPIQWVYQDVLFILLPICWVSSVVKRRTTVGISSRGYFDLIVVALVGLTLLGVLISTFAGQPVYMGLKAMRGYYLLLFFFVFVRSAIDFAKLTKFIVAVGLALCLANNVQYLYWGEINLFRGEVALQRLGNLRFLSGDFFTIFSPLIAFGQFLTNRKKTYLFASLYMFGTVVVQGQTRAVIFGFFFTCLALMFLFSNSPAKKFIVLGGFSIAIALSFLILPDSNFVRGLWDLTSTEVSSNQGNVAIRMRGYEYYIGEFLKSPIWGRGIWSVQVAKSNPENVRQFGVELIDLGVISVLFRFGSLGIIWLAGMVGASCFSLSRILRMAVSPMDLGVLAYFIFASVTAVTLNCFVDGRTILYLALALAVIAQHDQFGALGEDGCGICDS